MNNTKLHRVATKLGARAAGRKRTAIHPKDKRQVQAILAGPLCLQRLVAQAAYNRMKHK